MRALYSGFGMVLYLWNGNLERIDRSGLAVAYVKLLKTRQTMATAASADKKPRVTLSLPKEEIASFP